MLLATRDVAAHPGAVSATFLSYQELRRRGLSRSRIDGMLEQGRLIRVRRGRYVNQGTHPDVIRAARLGVRLDCVSLLRTLGVFVYEREPLHVQASRGASRLPRRSALVVCHWRETCAGDQDLVADIVEALAQSCLCQDPRRAIATLDSAWHLGLVDEEAIAEVFRRLPRRFQTLRTLIDRRSEAGTETLIRLAVRGLGRFVEVQAEIVGVGRVDLLVDGWLIIECDSEEFHSSWRQQRKDRRRDAEALRRGYRTLRLIAEDILFHQEWVLATIKAVLDQSAPSSAHNSSKIPGRQSTRRKNGR